MNKIQLDEELEKRLTARGLLNYARDYYIAFKDLHEKHPKDTDMYEIKYYLICHSIELTFKAVLKEKGYTRKKLVALGHDLEKLIDELYKNDVIMNVEAMKRTILANEYYKTKQFEYPQVGYKSLPNLEDMKGQAKLLLDMTTNMILKLYP